ncbi:MAG: hypothetical protein HZB68_00205 [Candidatus Aenigmarchaeota archaeon]|nr:hypothetical protein [Candidatus Aenigmarchaeota archaeon]
MDRKVVFAAVAIAILGLGFVLMQPKAQQKEAFTDEKFAELRNREITPNDEEVVRESLDYIMKQKISKNEKVKYSSIAGKLSLQDETTGTGDTTTTADQTTTTTLLLDPEKGWYDDFKGDFSYAEKCKLGQSTCTDVKDKDGFTASFFTTNAWTSVAHYGASLKDSFKARADEELYWSICDMQLIIENCNLDPQRCLWVASHINILYDGIKGKNGNYESLNDPRFYRGLQCDRTIKNKVSDISDDYKNTIIKVAEASITNPRTDDSMVASFESRGLSAAYKITGDSKYLNAAKTSVTDSKATMWSKDTLLYNNNGYEVRANMCWTMLAELDIYDMTKDSSYLNDAKAFADKSQVASHMTDTNFIGELAPCLEVLSRLETYNLGYDEQASKMKAYVYNNYLDSKNSPLYTGEGGFMVTSIDSIDSAGLRTWGDLKTVLDTSYMAYTLGRFRKESVGQ